MATITPNVAAVANNGQAARPLPLLVPAKVYATNQNRAEQGLVLQNMQENSEMTKGLRLRQHLSTIQHERASSSATDGTATPGSGGSSPEIQATRNFPISLGRSWENLWAHVKLSALFGQNAEGNQPIDRNRGNDRLIDYKVEDFTEGFPRFAKLLSSDPDFTIFRGFDYLHCRILLQLEVELTELEKELWILDKADIKDPQRKNRMRGTKHEQGSDGSQRELMAKIRLISKEYGETIIRHNQIQSLGQPPPRSHRSVYNWVLDNKPLFGGYYDFMFHSKDFVSVKTRNSNQFEEWIEEHMNRWPNSPLKKLLKTQDESNKTTNPHVNHYSPSRLSILAKVISVSLVAGLLMIPVFVLFLVPMSRGLMAVTAASFILTFSVIVSATTKAKVHEVFFGSAGYGAVLIMFLGNINQLGGPQ